MYLKQEWPYMVGMWAAVVFFSLQTILLLLFKFIYYDSNPFEFYPIISIGFIVGAIVASIKTNLKLYKLSVVFFWCSLIVSGYLISIRSTYNWLIIYSFLLMFPLGFLLTSGFLLFNTKKLYKYELIGSVCGLITILLFTSKSSIELALIIFLISSAIISFYLFNKKVTAFVVLISFAIGFVHLKSDKFNLMTYINDIYLPNYKTDIYKNGFQSIRSGQVDLLNSKWSLGERIDVGRTREDGRLLFYYNNTMWSEISSKDETKQGPFRYFPNAHSLLDIGSGGGQTLREALNAGIEVVKGVEINTAIFDLMNGKYREYSGDIYNYVELVEGRNYLEKSEMKYDLITIIKSSEKPNFVPNHLTIDYLSSKEGISLMHRRLSDSGHIIWSSNVRPHSKDWVAASLFGVLDSVRKSDETNEDLLNRVIVFTREDFNSYDLRKSDLLIFLKKNEVSNTDVENYQALIKK